ncbi:MAG: hypothetical protein IJ599_00900 [Alphaproteobacteria bacterium]|nr:hypothetical protein [Alphaproteobacteria bacterium]
MKKQVCLNGNVQDDNLYDASQSSYCNVRFTIGISNTTLDVYIINLGDVFKAAFQVHLLSCFFQNVDLAHMMPPMFALSFDVVFQKRSRCMVDWKGWMVLFWLRQDGESYG